MTSATALRAPIARYAARLHATAGNRHHVASPLGAWLLVALCAPAARQAGGRIADDLAEALGVDLDQAAAIATALLDDPHPAVLSAAALWVDGAGDLPDTGRAWVEALPERVEVGDIPSQERIDAWADRHTLGLIKRFPVELGSDIVMVLATALATKVSWLRPFELVPADRLGAGSPWTRTPDGAGTTESAADGAGGVSRVLLSPDETMVEQFIAHTAEAGDVAVHTGLSAEGLRVTSVIAGAAVPPSTVLAVAHEIAVAGATHQPVDRRSLFDLPIGDAPLWTITESAGLTTNSDGREERCTAVLPAWRAESRHSLMRSDLGVPAAIAATGEALHQSGPADAVQAAVARYSRVGFEAAAISTMFRTVGFLTERDGVIRTAELRFCHPYAVVAVAGPPRGTKPTPWLGLPVFSAWVAEPAEATD